MEDPPAPPTSGNTNFTQGILLFAIILITLSATVAGLRFATRAWIVKGLGWDDYTMMFAVSGAMVGIALDCVETHYGFGRQEVYLTPHQLQEFQKYTWGEWIQTFATLMWTKVSTCLFLLRIPVAQWLIRPLQAALVILIVSNVILTLLWIVQCQPVAAAWDESLHGICFSKDQLRSIIFAQAMFSVISDFSFAAYPILMLWNVRMRWKTKVGLYCLMGLGVITGACCIGRTVLIGGAVPEDDVSCNIPPFSKRSMLIRADDGVANWIWRSFEVNIGIIAACIPALRPGYKCLRKRAGGSKKNSTVHHPLADNPLNRHGGDSTTFNPPRIHVAEEGRLDIPDSVILKTTTLDVEEGYSH